MYSMRRLQAARSKLLARLRPSCCMHKFTRTSSSPAAAGPGPVHVSANCRRLTASGPQHHNTRASAVSAGARVCWVHRYR